MSLEALAAPGGLRRMRLLAADWSPLTSSGRGIRRKVDRIASAAGFSSDTEYLPWGRLQMEAKARGRSLVYPLVRCAESEGNWHWLTVLSTEEVLLWVRQDATKSLGDADLSNLRIGVLQNSTHTSLLTNRGFHVEPAPTEASNAKKLALGRIQGWATVRSVSDHWFSSLSIDPAQFHPPLALCSIKLYLAATRDLTNEELDPWLKACKQGAPGASSQDGRLPRPKAP